MHKPLLIFDWDGVLFDTMSIMRACYTRVLGELGIPMVDDATLRSFVGPTDDQNARSLGMEDPQEIERFMRLYWNTQYEIMFQKGRLTPGVEDMLHSLDGDFTMCLVSNGGHNYVYAGLVCFNILPLFDDVTTSRAKIKKAVTFQRLADTFPHSKIITVGDRKSDIDAGLAVHANNIATSYGFGCAEEFKDAGWVVNNAREMEDVIRSI